jgi:DNA-directed RNA polymerase specialized sigma24 family protein
LRVVAGDAEIGGVNAAAVHRRLDALWRMESPKLLARLARITGNIDTAEELAQDVLVALRWSAGRATACRTTRRHG